MSTTDLDALWQTELFAATRTRVDDPGLVSPAAAYQDALHARAVLLDLRTDAERARDGRIDRRLPVREVRPGSDLTDLAHAGRLYLVTSTAPTATRPAVEPAGLAALEPGDPAVATVRGGFDAWRAAGLPVAS